MVLTPLLAGPLWASSVDDDRKAALAGDYQAQRNFAYALAQGDGVLRDPVEACAWRMVIVARQGTKVTAGDVSNVQADCSTHGSLGAARARALTVLLPTPTRNVSVDVADLTHGACPQSACNGPLASLAFDYRSAISGDAGAARRVAECLSGGCGTRALNLFYACVMTRLASRSDGSGTLRDLRALDARTCAILGPFAVRSADEHASLLATVPLD